MPDKRLRLVSEPVKHVDAGIRKLIDDMFETMYEAPGIGLAAIQIGVAKRVITMDLSKKEDDHEPQVFINPEIVWTSDETAKYEEGCLSIPEYYEEVERPSQVKVKYLDRDGKPHEIEAKGLFATCLQHEIDHINGVSVHRSSVQAQARPRHQEVRQSRQEGGGVIGASPRLHGHAGLCRAHARGACRRRT